MNSALQDALVISGIGMGMVFLAILFLWGLMEVLVRLFPARSHSVAVPAKETPVLETGREASRDLQGMRVLAVTLAVSAALAIKRNKTQETGSKNTNELSPWQLAMRVDSIQHQHAVGIRKSKGVAGNEN